MDRVRVAPQVTPRSWVWTGIIGGIIAATAMGMVAMLWMWLAGQGFWKPMNLIASLVMGQGVVSGGFETVPTLVGMMIHLMLSAIFGLIFAYVVVHLTWSSAMILGAAILYGLLLWVINIVIINDHFIPAGFRLAPTSLVVIVHLVWGLVLGLVTAPKLAREA